MQMFQNQLFGSLTGDCLPQSTSSELAEQLSEVKTIINISSVLLYIGTLKLLNISVFFFSPIFIQVIFLELRQHGLSKLVLRSIDAFLA